MIKGEWQLPVLESRITNELYIKHNAKYHYFIGDGIEPRGGMIRSKESLCGRYEQYTEEFESLSDEKIYKEIACKKCYEKWKKIYEINTKD